MASVTYRGTGTIDDSLDFKEVRWEGLTKGGNAIIITLTNAINVGNIDWTFAEKNDVVPAITFEACYDNTNAASSSNAEPWTLEVSGDLTAGASEIILGAGKFYVNDTLVALTRGGGSFNVEREAREINADGDRGMVKGRVVFESARAKLTMNILTMLTHLSDLYSGIETVV